jgi:hypothetical protein
LLIKERKMHILNTGNWLYTHCNQAAHEKGSDLIAEDGEKIYVIRDVVDSDILDSPECCAKCKEGYEKKLRHTFD